MAIAPWSLEHLQNQISCCSLGTSTSGASTSSSQAHDLGAVTEMDVYLRELKSGEAESSRELFLIRKTLTKRQERITPGMGLNEVELYIKDYPHYMNTEMVRKHKFIILYWRRKQLIEV